MCPVFGCLRVRLLCCSQYFGWYAVSCVAQWSACPAVGCVGPCWPCRVGSSSSSCVAPVWYVLTVRRPLMVGRVLREGQVATIGTTAQKVLKFGTTCPVPPWRHRYTHNPSSGISQCPLAVLSASLVPIICTPPLVARPLRSPSVHPCAPHGSPRVLRLLGGAVLVLVFAGPSCAVSCRVLWVRWCACWCLSAVSGGGGAPAPALVSVRPVWHGGLGSAQHSRVRPQEPAGLRVPRRELLAPCVFMVGVRREKECWSVLRPPSRSLTLSALWAAGNVSLAPLSQVTCAEVGPAPQGFHFLGGGARELQWRTYPLTLALGSNVLDDSLITFPWSSASPWVRQVWLPHWPGPSCAPLVEEEA